MAFVFSIGWMTNGGGDKTSLLDLTIHSICKKNICAMDEIH